MEREQKIAAMLLSALVTTDDGELEDFRRKRLPRGVKVPVDDLRRLREVLVVLGEALRVDDEPSWETIRYVHASLTETRESRRFAVISPTSVVEGPPPSNVVFTPPPPAPVEVAPAPPFADEHAEPVDFTVLETPVPPPSEIAERFSAAPLPFAPRLPAEPTAVSIAIPTLPPSAPSDVNADDPLPFRRSFATLPAAEPEVTPALTLEAYASLRAMCSAFPDRRREVLARYGVSDALTELRVDNGWRERFGLEPADAERYAELFAHYRTWFEAHGDSAWRDA